MIAGLFSFERPPKDWAEPSRLAGAMAPFQPLEWLTHWNDRNYLFLQMPVAQGAASSQLFMHASGVVVAFWGRLDNKPELVALLNLNTGASDAETVALAWLKWGEACPEHLRGDFSLAIAQPQERLLFLARDIMGVKPLLYRIDAEGLFFANTLAAFKPLRLGSLTPSRRWMAEYMADISYHGTETAYREVKKLAPAHSLLIKGNGRVSLRRYHAFETNSPIAHKAEPSFLEAYRAVWQQAVACRVPSSGNIGCENSGGLDSGSITSEVARQLGPEIDRLHGLGFSYEPLEPEYIRATTDQWGINNSLLYNGDTTPDTGRIQQRVLQVNGAPQEHANGYSHFPFYEYCQSKGIHHLLSGFGGDEAVTYPGGVPARLELLDQGQWRALWQRLPGSTAMRFGRLLKTVGTGLRMPAQNAAFLKSWKARWPHHFLHPNALAEFGIEPAYFATATYDERFRTVNDAVAYLLHRPMLATRLENCSLMAASYGIDYAWPLLDPRLIQQYLYAPVHWKVGPNGISRFLHRSAVAGVCPDKVAWKPNKDMGFMVVAEASETSDNSAFFHRAIALADEMPSELSAICDSARIKSLAKRAIDEQWRGIEVQCAWALNVNNLTNLHAWINSDKSKY